MKTIRVTYTVLDVIEVPDDYTDEEIKEALIDNWTEFNGYLISDMEWEEIK